MKIPINWTVKPWWLLFGLTLAVNTIAAQTMLDSSAARVTFAQAEKLSEENLFQRSSTQATELQNVFRELELWTDYRKTIRLLYDNNHARDLHQANIVLVDQALSTLPQDESEIRARFLGLKARSYDAQGKIHLSIKAYEEALQIFRDLDLLDWLNYIYGNLGVAYTKIGDYQKGIDYHEKACEVANTLESSAALWNHLYNLSSAYVFVEEATLAREMMRQAKDIYDPEDGSFDELEAMILAIEGRSQESILYIDAAINKYELEYGREDTYTLGAKQFKAQCMLDAGLDQLALAQVNNLIPAFLTGEDKREYAKLLIVGAQALSSLNRINESQENFQKALDALTTNSLDLDPKSIPKPEDLGLDVWILEILKGKGDNFYKKWNSTNLLELLTLADANFQLCVDHLDELRGYYDESQSKLIVAKYGESIFNTLLEVKWKLYETTKEKKYLEESFVVTQKAKAYLLREVLQKKEARRRSNIPEATIQKLDGLQLELLNAERILIEGNDPSLDSIRQSKFDLKFAIEQIEQDMENQFPSYAKFNDEMKVATVAELQKQLDSDQALLKYFIGNNLLYVFTITSKDFGCQKRTLPSNFDQLISDYRRSISDLGFVHDSMLVAEQQFLASAPKLFDLLIKDVVAPQDPQEKISRLIIVPDKILNTIPFQCLMVEPSGSWTDAKKYLIQKYSVTNLYYCGMLNDPPKTNDEINFAAFGLEFDAYTLEYLKSIMLDSIVNPTINENIRSNLLTKLPFSDEEAIELAHLMGGTAWVNEEATKSRFEEEINSSNLIHIATHSIINDDEPLLSSLIFTKTKDQESNLLRLEDIYHLDLDANLVVLSACNTAYGKAEVGEGLNSLAKAFQVNGVPSVTATLWSIADEASKNIMYQYYIHLNEGMSKDLALQQAQLDYLNDDNLSSPNFRKPTYWAAWVHVGQTASIYKEPNLTVLMLSIIAAMLLFLLNFLLRKNKRAKSR